MFHLKTIIAGVLLGTMTLAFAQNEFFVDLSAASRALSKELQTSAHASAKRFDDKRDVSALPAWLIGSCHTAAEDFHLIAYYDSPRVAYVGVFDREQQLSVVWKFPCDARQFYVEGTRLMFLTRPAAKADSAETFAKINRETIVDFSALPPERTLRFHDSLYALPK